MHVWILVIEELQSEAGGWRAKGQLGLQSEFKGEEEKQMKTRLQ